MIRSRTAEVLAQRGGLDARSCGSDIDPAVPVPLSNNLLAMANIVVCMEEEHAAAVRSLAMFGPGCPPVLGVIDVPDIFDPFDHTLISRIVSGLESIRLHEVAAAIRRGAESVAYSDPVIGDESDAPELRHSSRAGA